MKIKRSKISDVSFPVENHNIVSSLLKKKNKKLSHEKSSVQYFSINIKCRTVEHIYIYTDLPKAKSEAPITKYII